MDKSLMYGGTDRVVDNRCFNYLGNENGKIICADSSEIEKLQKEAARARAGEVAGVIAKIKTAIDFYGIAQDDLFGSGAAADGSKIKRKYTKRNTAPVKKAPSPAKYKNPETGKTWTGHGMRPGWFVRAVESGMKPEDMAI